MRDTDGNGNAIKLLEEAKNARKECEKDIFRKKRTPPKELIECVYLKKREENFRKLRMDYKGISLLDMIIAKVRTEDTHPLCNQ
jgi:hypothetical protein